MKKLVGTVTRRPSFSDRGEDGQGLTEYALILSLVSVVGGAALVLLSSTIDGMYGSIQAAIP